MKIKGPAPRAEKAGRRPHQGAAANGRPSKEYLLDDGALLAVILNRPGHERVRAILERSSIDIGNYVLAVSQLVTSTGVEFREAARRGAELGLDVVRNALTVQQSRAWLKLVARTGLSLGEGLCLTVAAAIGAIAVTTNPRCKELEGRRLAGGRVRVEVIG